MTPSSASAMAMDHGGGPQVSIEFAAFAPPVTTVLAGDTVTWSNDASRAHTVTAEDSSFDSGRLSGGTTFHRTFTQAGANPYYCRLHPFMHGEVDVYRLLIDAPAGTTTAPGVPFTFSGRSVLDPGTELWIQADSGSGFHDAATATVGQDGTFRATVTPDVSGTYRAVTASSEASAPVSLLVLDRTVSATATTRRRRATVDAVVTPASPGASVVLQLRLRDRFGWWPVARAKAGRDGRARFVVPVGHRVPARVVLTLADGATILAKTTTFSVGA